MCSVEWLLISNRLRFINMLLHFIHLENMKTHKPSRHGRQICEQVTGVVFRPIISPRRSVTRHVIKLLQSKHTEKQRTRTAPLSLHTRRFPDRHLGYVGFRVSDTSACSQGKSGIEPPAPPQLQPPQTVHDFLPADVVDDCLLCFLRDHFSACYDAGQDENI